MIKKRTIAAFIAAVMTMSVFTGCGSSSDSTGTAGNESGGTNQVSDTGNDEVKVLRYGLSGFKGMFMPIMYDTVYDNQFCQLFFEPLVRNDNTGEYKPYLADWELEDDNLTYVFTLKDGITFGDGKPLNAEDVEFTYRMIAHPDYTGSRSYTVSQLIGYESFHAGETDEFPGIEVRDEKTIAFKYQDGNASPANIVNYIYGIMNKDYYQADTWEEFITKLSEPGEAGGSGPYNLAEYKPKELIRCVKNDNYWDKENHELYFDEVLGIEVPEENIIAALQTNQIDFGELIASMDNAEALDVISGVRRYNYLANGFTYMTFNCRNGIFDDKLVRQAFLYALDRKSFIQVEYGELAEIGLTPISPVSWAFPDADDLNAYDYDLEKAGQLLDEAGWIMSSDGYRYKDGEKLSVTWWVYQDAPWPGTLSGMAADSWKQIGIDLKIDLMDFATVSSRTKDATKEPREFDIYTMGFSLDAEPDPKGGIFDQDTYEAGGFDCSGYKNQDAQELIKKARMTFDQEERKAYYQEWGKMMNEEIPSTIVAYRNYLWGISERIEGMDFNAMTDWSHFIMDTKFTD